MTSPAALEQWATKLYDDVARVLACPEYCLDNDAVRLKAEMNIDEGKRAIPIVQGLLQSDLDSSTAASALAAICEARLLDENGRKDSPQGLWEVACSAIEHFADDEAGSCAKLAALMFELSKFDVRKANGDVVKTGGRKFWHDLPLWHLYFGERMIVILDGGRYGDRTEAVIQWARRLQNGNLFQAYWLAHIGKKGSEEEYKMATWTPLEVFRQALERNYEDSLLGRRRAEHYVLAAVHWIFLPGAAVLQLCREEYRRDASKVVCHPVSDAGTDGSYNYTGDDGFHMERWGVWKAAFRRVAATEGIETNVATKAAAAADEMDRLERSDPAPRLNSGP